MSLMSFPSSQRSRLLLGNNNKKKCVWRGGFFKFLVRSAVSNSTCKKGALLLHTLVVLAAPFHQGDDPVTHTHIQGESETNVLLRLLSHHSRLVT